MPSSVHKILCHGKLVIASWILPIGQLSEEAQEARKKDNRRYREYFTRKTSRIDTNIDLINRGFRLDDLTGHADIHTEVRRCTVMLCPHPLTNSQRYASLQCAYPQPSQCCISLSLDWKGRSNSTTYEVIWSESLSLFSMGYLKALVFETPEMDMELVARIVAAFDVIQNTPAIFVRVRQNLALRLVAVIFALRLVAVNLSNCCKIQNGTLIVSMYFICR